MIQVQQGSKANSSAQSRPHLPRCTHHTHTAVRQPVSGLGLWSAPLTAVVSSSEAG